MANKIRELRNQRKWTQKELARRAGIIQNQLSNYETGKIQPTLSVLKKIARALGVEHSVLLVGDTGDNHVVVESTEPELTDQYMKVVFDETVSMLDQKSKRFLLEFLQLLKWKMEIKKF